MKAIGAFEFLQEMQKQGGIKVDSPAPDVPAPDSESEDDPSSDEDETEDDETRQIVIKAMEGKQDDDDPEMHRMETERLHHG